MALPAVSRAVSDTTHLAGTGKSILSYVPLRRCAVTHSLSVRLISVVPSSSTISCSKSNSWGTCAQPGPSAFTAISETPRSELQWDSMARFSHRVIEAYSPDHMPPDIANVFYRAGSNPLIDSFLGAFAEGSVEVGASWHACCR